MDEADYFGTSVVVARRLCDRADAGQILAGEVVTYLLGGRQEFSFRQLGGLELKGIREPVPAVEVLYEHDVMALLRHTPFVGRQAEFAELEQSFAEACAGHGAVVVLGGEPGIGKTRLAEEFCDTARPSGATVARGNSYEGEISAPYQPWVELLRSYAATCDDNRLLRELGVGGAKILTLLPELRPRFPAIDQAPRLEPEAERARLFDSIMQFVQHVSQTAPLVLFLDDMQWADRPSLLLLQLIARNTISERVLILGTYRDVELNSAKALADTLSALRRLDRFQRIAVRGLEEDSVKQLLSTIEPSEEAVDDMDALALALTRETEGNPFFIREVLTHLVDEKRIVHEGARRRTLDAHDGECFGAGHP